MLHAPLNVHKLEHEPKFNHALDAYGLFLVIHSIYEWEEMTWREHADALTCLFSDFFSAKFSKEYFQKIAERIKDDFKPLSDHPKLINLGDLLEKIQEQTGLAFHVGF